MTCQNCGNEVAPYLKFCPKCGTPAASAPSAYSPPAEQMQSSWAQNPQFAQTPVKRKSRVGKVLLIIGLVLMLIVAGVGVAVYFGYRYLERTLKASEAYALAESTLKESEAVKARMGAIRNTGFPIGSFKEDADGTGNAVFNMSVEGEKASGRYFVVMRREKSRWSIVHATVNLADGESIKIIDVTTPGGDDDRPEDNTNGNANSNANQPPASNTNRNTNSRPISGGVLNGKAISKPAPPYPPAAKAARAQGTVTVEVIVDEEGKVISAKAVSGHPLLHASAESAARQARFSPTLLSGKPVKVSGIINYNFTLEE